MNKKTNTKKTPEVLSNEALQPLITYCHETRGGMFEIMRIYTEICGKTAHRGEFQRWLAADPKDRAQPRFGTGLVLMEVFEVLMTQKADDKPGVRITVKRDWTPEAIAIARFMDPITILKFKRFEPEGGITIDEKGGYIIIRRNKPAKEEKAKS